MAVKTILLATALLLAGLATRGAEAGIVAIIHGIVPCSNNTDAVADVSDSPVFANASVHLVVGDNNNPIPGTRTTTNNKGHFKMILNVTSSDMMASLASNSKAVVTTPLAACKPSLPSSGTLTAPLLLHGSITLTNSAEDNQLRSAISTIGKVKQNTLAADLACLVITLLDRVVGARNDDIGTTSVSNSMVTSVVDSFSVFGIGPASYSAAN
uniref:Dirigent protein n=1 Tax=Leersia perrieri TaxID=77586 RepID=A0A0D9X2V7_9ORYZ